MANALLEVLIRAKDEATATLKQVNSQFEGQSQNVKALGQAMVVAGGAVTAFAALSVKSFTDTADAIGDMSTQTGLSLATLSGLRLAGNEAGVSLDALGTSFNLLQRRLTEAAQGNKEAADSLTAIGVSVDQLLALSPDEQLGAVADAIASISDPAARSAAAMDAFGRSGAQLLPVLERGSKGIAENVARARELGVAYDQQAVTSAQNFKRATTELGASLDSLKATIAQAVLPAVEDLAESVGRATRGFAAFREEHPELADTFTKMVVSLGAITLAMGATILVVQKLTAAFALLSASMLGIVGLFAAIGIAAFSLGRAVGDYIVSTREMSAADLVVQETERHHAELRAKWAAEKIEADRAQAAAAVAKAKAVRDAEASIVDRLQASQKAHADQVAAAIKNYQDLTEMEQRVRDRQRNNFDAALAETLAISATAKAEADERLRLLRIESEALELVTGIRNERAAREFDKLQALVRGLPPTIGGPGGFQIPGNTPGEHWITPPGWTPWWSPSGGAPPMLPGVPALSSGGGGAPVTIVTVVQIDGREMGRSVAGVIMAEGAP